MKVHLLCIFSNFRCVGSRNLGQPQTTTTRFHGNGHLPGNGNGHAHVVGDVPIVVGGDYEMDTYTPMLQENEHCDSKVS